MRTERGGGRPGLRLTLAVVLVYDVLLLLWHHLVEPPEADQPEYWPQFLYAISGTPWLLWTIAACALTAIALFAARRFAIVSGFAVLLCVGLLNEAYTSTVPAPRRMFFMAGATLIGWLAGLVLAKLLQRDDQAAERLAEAGAVAGLAATFAGASIQKLLARGLFEDSAMRAVILDHAPYSGGLRELIRMVAENALVTRVLSTGVVFLQLGGILMIFGGRLRVIGALGLITFHLGTLVMLDIIYLQSTVLLLAVALPWHRLTRKAPEMVPVQPLPMKAAVGLLACLVAFSAIGALVPTPGIVGRGPESRWANEDRPPGYEGGSEAKFGGDSPRVVSVGPFRTGDILGAWRCVNLKAEPPRLVVAFESGANVAVFEIRPLRSQDGPQPLDLPGLRIALTHRVGSGPFESVGAAVQGKLRSASDTPGLDFPTWLDQRKVGR